MARLGPFSDPEHITLDQAPPAWSDPAHVSTWVVDPHLEWFVWDGVALHEVEPLGVRP